MTVRTQNHTPERRSELMRQAAIMHASGKNWRLIAQELGTDYTVWAYWRRKYADEWKARHAEAVAMIGERPHQKYTKPKPETIAAAAKMHAQGATQVQIAEKLGVTGYMVENWRASCKEHWDAVYIAEKQPFDAPLEPLPKQDQRDPRQAICRSVMIPVGPRS